MAKRAASAYWLWLEENRASLIVAHGLIGKRSSEVSKKAGELWKAMDPVSKMKYDDLAAKDKIRYEEDVKAIGKRVRVGIVESSTGKKARKDPAAPKQPLCAFFMWAQDSRERAKKLRPGRAAPPAQEFSYEAWKRVSEKIKKSYEDKAILAKEKYKKDLEHYHLQRASCQSSFTYVPHQWNLHPLESSKVQDDNVKDSGICECGEPLNNGVRFCEQCGEENPQHKDASTHRCPADKDVNQVEDSDLKDIKGSECTSLDAVKFGQQCDAGKMQQLAATTSCCIAGDGTGHMEGKVGKGEADEEVVPTGQLVTKEEILHLACFLEKEEIVWLCKEMAAMATNMAS